MTDALNYFYPMYNYSSFFTDFDQEEKFNTIAKHILHQFYKIRRNKVYPHFTNLLHRDQFMTLSNCIRNIIGKDECTCELQHPNLSHEKYHFSNQSNTVDIQFRFIHQSHRKMGIFGKK